MPSSAAMFGTDSAMSSLGRQNSSLRITATQRDCVATGMTAIRWLTFNAPAEWTPTFPQGRWAKGLVDEVGADGPASRFLRVRHEIHSPASGSSTAPG